MLRFFEGLCKQAVCNLEERRHTANRPSSLSFLPLLLILAFGLPLGLSGWSTAAQAALSASEQGEVSRYIQAFDAVNPPGSDRQSVLAAYIGNSSDPYATIQYLLSIGGTLSTDMQGLVGGAIAQFTDSVGLENPSLAASVTGLIENLPAASPIVSGYNQAAEILTSRANVQKNIDKLPSDVRKKLLENQGSPN